jgi:hypothetical protein
MKIGILGAGNIGSTLAWHWGALRHEVTIANSRGPETLGEGHADGARAVTVEEAVKNACQSPGASSPVLPAIARISEPRP